MRRLIRIIHIIATTSRNFDIANLLIYIKNLEKAFEKFINNLKSLRETIHYIDMIKKMVEELKKMENLEPSDYEVPKPKMKKTRKKKKIKLKILYRSCDNDTSAFFLFLK
jgi:hypothetical protein